MRVSRIRAIVFGPLTTERDLAHAFGIPAERLFFVLPSEPFADCFVADTWQSFVPALYAPVVESVGRGCNGERVLPN